MSEIDDRANAPLLLFKKPEAQQKPRAVDNPPLDASWLSGRDRPVSLDEFRARKQARHELRESFE